MPILCRQAASMWCLTIIGRDPNRKRLVRLWMICYVLWTGLRDLHSAPEKVIANLFSKSAIRENPSETQRLV